MSPACSACTFGFWSSILREIGNKTTPNASLVTGGLFGIGEANAHTGPASAGRAFDQRELNRFAFAHDTPRQELGEAHRLAVFDIAVCHALAFALYFHLPGFLLGIGATEVQIGVIFGLTGFTAIMLRPPLGRAMDRKGRRIVILTGGIMHACICFTYLTVTHLGPWVYVVRIIHGIAEAMLFASLFALAADIVPASRRVQGIGLFVISGMLPMSLSGLLGDFILAHGTYARIFQVPGVFATLALLLSFRLYDPPRAAIGEPTRSFFAAVTQRDLLPLWGTGACFATAIAAYFTFMKTYVAHTASVP